MIKLNRMIIILGCVLAFIKHVHQSSADQNFKINQNETNKDFSKNLVIKKLDINSISSNFNLNDINIPKFMLDIYETHSSSKINRFNTFAHNSNTIRNHWMEKENKTYKFKRNKSGFLIKFDVNLSIKEKLNAGELRIYLNRKNRCKSGQQKITINQIIQQDQQMTNKPEFNDYTTIQDENGLVYRQIDTLVIKYDLYMDLPIWLQFNVLQAVESWIKKTYKNDGFLIKSYCIDGNEFILNEDKFVDNFVLRPTTIYNEKGDFRDEIYEDFKPILLTYSYFNGSIDNGENIDLFLAKKKRDINSETTGPILDHNGNNGTDRMNSTIKRCSVNDMIVNFDSIGWKNVVLPREFKANYCDGRCSISDLPNDTLNYSKMQILHTDRTPKLCCKASKYDPLTMIVKENNSFIIRIYEEMIVTECSCN